MGKHRRGQGERKGKGGEGQGRRSIFLPPGAADVVTPLHILIDFAKQLSLCTIQTMSVENIAVKTGFSNYFPIRFRVYAAEK